MKNKRLKIAFFEPSRVVPGGGQILTANNVKYLSTKHEVILFTQRSPEKELDFGKAEIKLIKPHNRFLAPLAFLFHKIDKKDKFDIIITGSFPANLVNIRNNLPSVYISNSPPRFFYDLKRHFLKNSGLKGRLFVHLKNIFFKRFDYIAARKNTRILGISKEIQGRIKKYYGRDSYVFYPGIDPKKYKTGKYDDYILSVARLESPKRPKTIIKSMEFVKNKEIRLIMVGTGSMDREIRDMAKKHKNVEFRGYVSNEELKELYENCLAVVYIPVNEDYGYSPVEAGIAGKATIGVNEGGLKETIVDNKTGFLIDDITPQKVAEKIDLLAGNKKLAKKMGMEAKKFVGKFHLKNTFGVLDKAIEEAIEVHNRKWQK